VVTFGCPKNETDSEGFASVLSAAGWAITEEPEEAELLLVNTCAFIGPAVEESADYLADAMDWRRRKGGRRLVLAGCLPARYPDDGSGGLEEIDLVVGPGDSEALAHWLGVAVPPGLQYPVESPTNRYLKISDGCSNRCAFCTIPSIRGPYRSVGSEALAESAARLAAQGAAEVGLVGQDCGLWRDGGMNLAGLAGDLARRFPDIWWRCYYVHPAHFPDGLVAAMESTGNLMPYLDLPMQHASDRVLRRMGRPYGETDLRAVLDTAESAGREIAVRATFIVGYPGETEADFRRVLRLLEDYGCIRSIVAFPYSSEPGTREHARDGDRPGSDAVGRRLAALSAAADAAWLRWAERLEGRTLPVLVDEPGTGHTMYDAPGVDSVCRLRGAGPAPGSVCQAEVISVRGSDIFVTCAGGGANRSAGGDI
jgi:ribosomal protein S12 methylthiotransferase